TKCSSANGNLVSASHPLPVDATVSASITGFEPASTGTPISVTTGGVTGSLPAGTVVIVSNVGTTNGAYCKLGASATTADQLIPPNSWFAFTVGAATQLTCITSTSTTTVNMVGGSGLPTGSGGGGGSSGGGTSSPFSSAFPATGTAIGLNDGTNMQAWLTALALGDGVNGNNTGAVASWLYNGTTFDRQRGDATNGAWVNVKTSVLPTGAATSANQTSQITQETATAAVLGTTADATCGTATGTCTLAQLIKFLNNAATSAIPSGTNLIGKVGIDQTTPGTTNGVQVNAAIPAGTNLIGNTGTLYPAGSTPITASATGTTGATTATLAGTSAKSTYICGFSIRANATAAATADSTVTGTVTGTLHYTQWTAPNASGIGLTEQIFSPCIIASATNTGIAVISAAPGTGGVVSVAAWGFQL